MGKDESVQAWHCCGKKRRAGWCCDCGKRCPQEPCSEAESLADEFAALASRAYNTAKTFTEKADRIEKKRSEAMSGAPDTSGMTDEDANFKILCFEQDVLDRIGISYHARRTAEAQRRRGDKLSRWESVLRNLIAKYNELGRSKPQVEPPGPG
jgi:hypothetical protein